MEQGDDIVMDTGNAYEAFQALDLHQEIGISAINISSSNITVLKHSYLKQFDDLEGKWEKWSKQLQMFHWETDNTATKIK